METLWTGKYRIHFVCSFLREKMKFGPVPWRKVESIYGILPESDRQRILKEIDAHCDGEFVVQNTSLSPEFEADDSR